jgi:glutathionylspermidine synthase
MIPHLRHAFNANFSKEKYDRFLQKLNHGFPEIPFRVAETPIFIPPALKEKLIVAGEAIITLIKQSNFKELTEGAIPKQWKVPNETTHPHFLTFDYGLCKDEHGEISPMLIEMQGFPSLYGFQSLLGQQYKESFMLSDELSPYFSGLTPDSYIELLKKVIVGNHRPEEVAIMDVDAIHQKTAIDFFVTAEKLQIKILSLDEIKPQGNKLFYEQDGQQIQLKRIYNRLIFDEIEGNPSIFEQGFDPRSAVDVEWITHPNWFYRISKYTMPFLKSAFVPETYFLNSMATLPTDLENYVLKPLFSFAGMGVVIDVTLADIQAIKDPEHWILQKKVVYEPIIQAPDGGVKAEIRMMYLWPEGEEPILCINLARLSRGKMIGVRYNKDFDWVGGTIALMPHGDD